PEICPDPLEVTDDAIGDYRLDLEQRPIDLTETLAGFRPWEGTPTGVDLDAAEMLGARWHTAMPPKPAHIALALSSGMFNGHRLEPNDPERHPPVLAKGVFERELVTVSERTNADGECVGTVEVEHPRLRLTALRLDTYRYAELAPGVVPTGERDPERWNAADLIDNYDDALVDLLQQQFPPLHDPADPAQQMALP
ncbi:MAG: hypothetical protein GY928_18595, partial [Colwellia sp.]|nr:hypothetical protein [Colwellia sp.]